MLLAALVICLAYSPVRAEPYVPDSGDRVVATLRQPSGRLGRELRDLRSALNKQPDNLDIATRLARRYIQIGRERADPRYLGYAQAALRPWWDRPDPPVEVLVLRATIRQSRHAFEAALKDLDRVLERDPRNGQARLTRATVLQVRGQFEKAQRDCAALARVAEPLVATTCAAGAASRSGLAQRSFDALSAVLARGSRARSSERVWAQTVLAEIAVRLGKTQAAERYFAQAVAEDPNDSYLLGAYADFLLAQGRPRKVQELLANKTRASLLLLRLALAEQRLAERGEDVPELEGHIAQLKALFDAARRRHSAVHRREEAMFRLHLLSRPHEALALARENWAVQREPADALIFLQAALAADEPAAAQTVVDWLANKGLEDARLAPLVKRVRLAQGERQPQDGEG